ncbi:hypothetical protein EDB92DRAFT_1934109 [Lactarius akahatsu]|uniref:Glycoside hydrolase family 79 protein n=1 Tax=Lactarius akahatsu TaxID=416441 RepID=A0AAD4LNH6_9AGAM|nr:hypothetical protein EDB92DRAFT_1934109 [Lactarius akahatsu]
MLPSAVHLTFSSHCPKSRRLLSCYFCLYWTGVVCHQRRQSRSPSLTAPSSAQVLLRSLVSNTIFFNTLDNLRGLAGEPVVIRIGANSEDRTNFDPSVSVQPVLMNVDVCNSEFLELSTMVPCLGITSHLGGQFNLATASLEATAIANAFASLPFNDLDVTLEAIEVGNEADLYISNRVRDSSFDVQQYVSQWTAFTENVTAAVNDVLGKRVPLQGAAFAEPSHTAAYIVPCGFADQAVCSRPSLVQSCHGLLQDHYSGSFCAGTHGVLQDFISKSGTGATPRAGAALWGLDFALLAGQLGITRVYFQNLGHKYNFPLASHIQSLYYAGIIAAEAIGPSVLTRVFELEIKDTRVFGHVFFEGPAVFIVLDTFTSGQTYETADGKVAGTLATKPCLA